MRAMRKALHRLEQDFYESVLADPSLATACSARASPSMSTI